MNIRYADELVALEPRELRMRQNFGEKSYREVQDKLAAVGLTLGVTLDDESYRAAVVATVAVRLEGMSEMRTGADRRRVARLTVPRRWRGGDLEQHLVHLLVLDLSALGARIAH